MTTTIAFPNAHEAAEERAVSPASVWYLTGGAGGSRKIRQKRRRRGRAWVALFWLGSLAIHAEIYQTISHLAAGAPLRSAAMVASVWISALAYGVWNRYAAARYLWAFLIGAEMAAQLGFLPDLLCGISGFHAYRFLAGVLFAQLLLAGALLTFPPMRNLTMRVAFMRL